MWRWMLRISAVFLFSSLVLTSPASAGPHFYLNVGVPGVAIGFGHPHYYYPYYPAYYPGYAYPYPGYVYGYPGYAYPRYGYAWHGGPRYGWYGGNRVYYGHRYYGGGGRYVRNYNGHVAVHGTNWHR